MVDIAPIDFFIYILDLFGTMAFAVTGAFKAIEHKADIVGIIILATITGVAGGTIRDVIFGKTSSGIKVVDASIFNTAANDNFVPLVKDSNISKFSMKKTFHVEHGHKRLHVKWSFGDKTNSKIVKHLFKSKEKLSVRLTQLEQNLLTEYGIQCGNKFQLSISGNRFLVEKTAEGLIILNHIENIDVVKAGFIKNKLKGKGNI